MLSVLAVVLALASPCAAWDAHGKLTATALAGMPELDSTAVVESLDAYASAVGLSSGAAVARALKLNANSPFAFAAGQVPGSTVTLRQILAAHVDEPDFGLLDEGVFDQFPELWREEYAALGGPELSRTRAFRHLYWAEGYFAPAPPGATQPVLVRTPLGDAVERCGALAAASRRAFASGRPYWGARFLSWGLHYVEDLTQPFHASQILSPNLLRRKPDGSLDARASAINIYYFHIIWDRLPTVMEEGGLGEAAKARRRDALSGSSAAPEPDALDARALCSAAATAASDQAYLSAEAALALFPPVPPNYENDPWNSYPPSLWAGVAAKEGTPAFGRLMTLAKQRLEASGSVARAYVRGVLASKPAPPAPAPKPEPLALLELRSQAP